jgi:acyl carrier protein
MTELNDISLETLIRWMKLHLATVLGEPVEQIATDACLSDFDLDSIDAVTMAFEMEERFGIPVNPETFMEGDLQIGQIAAKISQG